MHRIANRCSSRFSSQLCRNRQRQEIRTIRARRHREAKDPRDFESMDSLRDHLMKESSGPTLMSVARWITSGAARPARPRACSTPLPPKGRHQFRAKSATLVLVRAPCDEVPTTEHAQGRFKPRQLANPWWMTGELALLAGSWRTTEKVQQSVSVSNRTPKLGH